MAGTPWDPEHLEVVKKGADAIREWRKKNGDGGLRLRQADLRDAILPGVDLIYADLRGAILCAASLAAADLRRALLTGADLSDADLRRTDLAGADLRRANLQGANLRRADLVNSQVDDADFQRAVFGRTTIASDLTVARNLDQAQHRGPSLLDFVLVGRRTTNSWPVSFLRGCGLTDYEIDHGLAIAKGQGPIQFYSCFISYSSKDDRFAVKLHDALQARGIRCWLDKHEVLPGDNIYARVDEGIRLWDKVLLCGSEASLTSWWVTDEVTRGLEKEQRLQKERGHEVLAIIPLDLDGYLLDATRCAHEYAPTLRKRHAAQFRGWEADGKVFDEQLERVIKALRCDELARPKPPTPKL